MSYVKITLVSGKILSIKMGKILNIFLAQHFGAADLLDIMNSPIILDTLEREHASVVKKNTITLIRIYLKKLLYFVLFWCSLTKKHFSEGDRSEGI